jgi:2-polyprenyl-3-methyl-5-hydroxy-6-metoxy-1,4-benzoquinol methylase
VDFHRRNDHGVVTEKTVQKRNEDGARRELGNKDRELAELQNRDEGDLPLPSPQQIYLITGLEDATWFLNTGKASAQIIRDVLHNNGLDIEDFDSILDFGCGLGRIMRHWHTLEKADLHGSDYNPDLVAWCKDNLTFAEFRVNGLEDKLEYENEKFDFIYAWSVFTHLTESLHFHWIEELLRVLRPGGHLLITTHGKTYLQHYWESYRRHLLGTNQGDYLQHLIDTHGEEFLQQHNPLSQEQREQFRNGQLVVLGEDVAGSNQCNAFHTEHYVYKTLARDLTVVDFIPGGAGDTSSHQDLYLSRKP